jgi:hypothetical protein
MPNTGSTQETGREQRLCSPTSGFVQFTKDKADRAYRLFVANLDLPRHGRARRYISRISLDRNTARVWLLADGVRYFELGNSTLTHPVGPMRVPLSASIGGAWIVAYTTAYHLEAADDCNWVVFYSLQGNELGRDRHIIAPGP